MRPAARAHGADGREGRSPRLRLLCVGGGGGVAAAGRRYQIELFWVERARRASSRSPRSEMCMTENNGVRTHHFYRRTYDDTHTYQASLADLHPGLFRCRPISGYPEELILDHTNTTTFTTYYLLVPSRPLPCPATAVLHKSPRTGFSRTETNSPRHSRVCSPSGPLNLNSTAIRIVIPIQGRAPSLPRSIATLKSSWSCFVRRSVAIAPSCSSSRVTMSFGSI